MILHVYIISTCTEHSLESSFICPSLSEIVSVTLLLYVFTLRMCMLILLIDKKTVVEENELCLHDI